MLDFLQNLKKSDLFARSCWAFRLDKQDKKQAHYYYVSAGSKSSLSEW